MRKGPISLHVTAFLAWNFCLNSVLPRFQWLRPNELSYAPPRCICSKQVPDVRVSFLGCGHSQGWPSPMHLIGLHHGCSAQWFAEWSSRWQRRHWTGSFGGLISFHSNSRNANWYEVSYWYRSGDIDIEWFYRFRKCLVALALNYYHISPLFILQIVEHKFAFLM